MAEEEVEQLMKSFEALGARPKADTPSELLAWMEDFVNSKKEDPTSLPPDQKPPFPTETATRTPRQLLTNQLRLPTFSGDGKGESTFDLWRYEVTCLRKEKHSTEVIRQTIRRSLRGEAGRIVMRLGAEATIDDIMHKMESVYGEVEQEEILLAKFFSARQQDHEDVSLWGCRLEDLFSKAVKEEKQSDMKETLRILFWSGLRTDIKDITGHLYENIKDFDRLRVAIRRVELDHKHRQAESSTTKKSTQCKVAVTDADHPMTELKGMLQQLTGEVKTLKENQEKMRSQMEAPQQQHYQQRQQTRSYSGNQRRNRGFQHHDSHSTATATVREPVHPTVDAEYEDEIRCWKCGQVGHIAIGCRIRTDHRRRGNLNSNRPSQRGGC